MEFIKSLSESKMLASKSSYKNFTGRQVADLIYLHVIALKILFSEESTKEFAKDYAKRSARYIGFARWYQNATDLHLLTHAIVDEDISLKMPDSSQEFRENLYFDQDSVVKWLRRLQTGREELSMTRRLFMSLDGQLKIQDSRMKAIRRLVQNWDSTTLSRKQLSMTSLLQILRFRSRRSDLLVELEKLADTMKLELKNVANPETGEESPDDIPTTKKPSLLRRIAAYAAGGATGYFGARALMKEEDDVELDEEAAAAAAPAAATTTTSASIAQVSKPMSTVQKRKSNKYKK